MSWRWWWKESLAVDLAWLGSSSMCTWEGRRGWECEGWDSKAVVGQQRWARSRAVASGRAPHLFGQDATAVVDEHVFTIAVVEGHSAEG